MAGRSAEKGVGADGTRVLGLRLLSLDTEDRVLPQALVFELRLHNSSGSAPMARAPVAALVACAALPQNALHGEARMPDKGSQHPITSARCDNTGGQARPSSLATGADLLGSRVRLPGQR